MERICKSQSDNVSVLTEVDYVKELIHFESDSTDPNNKSNFIVIK